MRHQNKYIIHDIQIYIEGADSRRIVLLSGSFIEIKFLS